MALQTHWIVGPGAIGRLLALRLAQQGQRITLIGRRPLPGLQTLVTPRGETLDMEVVTRTRPPDGVPDLLHLTTKAYAAEGAYLELASRLPADLPLVLWQNGFHTQPRLATRHLGPVLCATTTEGAYVAADDRVVHAGRGNTLIGSLEDGHDDLARTVASLLSTSGLSAQAVPDIRRRLWHKLAINAAINPLVAHHRIRNGELRDTPFREEVEAVIGEVARVMEAEGIAPPEGSGLDGWRTLVWRVVEATASNRASMLQDVLAGRPTEHVAILGPLSETARRHGLATPRLDSLLESLAGDSA
ncbi:MULTISPECIES: ketopantoate reductase family protein [Halomonas]|uniref:2-dehydropantoate 2-reductase n=2 Tax=Halomonas TaxID=2745 RepID=A0A7X4VZV1_9GAMM|nr:MULTISPECIES: 2-dehydropantoate 2-reductase [Halomonas]MDR5902740.1 2-dehydropantoate 2-reductase [Halomonas icarae]NAW13296.1 2-dehydropantoate 2-reductase [Halomonas icarae]TDB01824.1 2-dehydropantoate 2-reductase [Halomonas marinisediminis]